MDKAPDAFRTISEVADDLDVPQHVLRFWETRFREIKPMKRGGGRRYYRPDDVNLLRGIRHLLYGEGYTIRGVQRILRDQGTRFVQDVWQPGAPQPSHGPSDDMTAEMETAPPQENERGGLFSLLSRRSTMEEREEPPAEREPPARAAERMPEPSGLSRDDLRKLQAALHELGECRRLLDTALKSAA